MANREVDVLHATLPVLSVKTPVIEVNFRILKFLKLPECGPQLYLKNLRKWPKEKWRQDILGPQKGKKWPFVP